MENNNIIENAESINAFSFANLLEEKPNDYDKTIESLALRVKELENKLKIKPENERTDIDKIYNGNRKNKKIVILVHGIRDFALWQSQVRASLRAAGLEVILTNYGRFPLFRFLIPVPVFRNSVIKNVKKQIRTVISQNPDHDVSIVAHSFGTFVVSNIINDEFDMVFDRIIFCGGVYSNNINFEQISNRFLPPILNEIGTKDYWPALAESVTWGYGSPGTFGCRKPLFEDRWHKDAGHSYFLSKEFCSDYWNPFLLNGTIKEGEERPDQPYLCVRFIKIIKIKYMVIVLIIFLIFLYFKLIN